MSLTLKDDQHILNELLPNSVKIDLNVDISRSLYHIEDKLAKLERSNKEIEHVDSTAVGKVCRSVSTHLTLKYHLDVSL